MSKVVGLNGREIAPDEPGNFYLNTTNSYADWKHAEEPLLTDLALEDIKGNFLAGMIAMAQNIGYIKANLNKREQEEAFRVLMLEMQEAKSFSRIL